MIVFSSRRIIAERFSANDYLRGKNKGIDYLTLLENGADLPIYGGFSVALVRGRLKCIHRGRWKLVDTGIATANLNILEEQHHGSIWPEIWFTSLGSAKKFLDQIGIITEVKFKDLCRNNMANELEDKMFRLYN
jgi:hypothetical protein